MIGENIRKRRREKGIEQKELARLVNVVPSMICQIERGSRGVNLALAGEIARVLDCGIQDFLQEGSRNDG